MFKKSRILPKYKNNFRRSLSGPIPIPYFIGSMS